ncbi:hypothetical protein I3F58_27700 [Streptomyces sp. MUM 203J]|uniref:hypothetical protein n=1 Tax=Streptomyces sp. MUM 203J TaxID=2791990 RepID=UPI001F0418AE|nr:hypothetical protein [Streptomyces sp. MUM 203J]MCH0543269.1 hypothetical protein [Streptomyces sp. MUM 203J]
MTVPRVGRRAVVAVAGVLLGLGGAGAWAAGAGPFAEERYCWGAWERDSGPRLLGDREPAGSGSERTAQEDGELTADSSRGTCTLLVTSSVEDDRAPAPGEGEPASGAIEFEKKVTVTHGPVPQDADARLRWLGAFVAGSMTPLPDGVPGLVRHGRGMVVLPEGCDTEGRPSVVTISGDEAGDGHLGLVGLPTRIGSEWDVAQLLLAVANTAMKQVGCASGTPLQVSSPVEVTESEDRGVSASRTCRIPGLGFKTAEGTHYEADVGAVNGGLQLCRINETQNVRSPEFAGQFAMSSQPRLAALFRGLADDRPVGEGRRWPDWPRKGENYRYSQLVSAGDGAGVRSCDIGLLGDRPEVRLTTVEDPDLAQMFRAPALSGGEPVKGTGCGRLGGDLTVFRTSCQTGDVVFVVQESGRSHSWSRELLPAYVNGEARRIGCGDVTVKLPG